MFFFHFYVRWRGRPLPQDRIDFPIFQELGPDQELEMASGYRRRHDVERLESSRSHPMLRPSSRDRAGRHRRTVRTRLCHFPVSGVRLFGWRERDDLQREIRSQDRPAV